MATVPTGGLGPQPACQGTAKWQSLGTSRQELTLDFTLPTGQSFRWRKSGEAEYTGVLNQRLVRISEMLAAISVLCPNHTVSLLPLSWQWM